MHQHSDHCGCGDHHHNHHHEHGEHCGCDHAPIATPEGLSPMQADILIALRERSCLPVAAFAMTHAQDTNRNVVALAPVYLSAPEDSMERVKEIGSALSALEHMNLLTLDYDIPLKGYPYAEYKASELYAFFVKTVEEGAAQPNATFNTPILDLGSMALTEEGEKMVAEIMA